jgi:hypothetical protein
METCRHIGVISHTPRTLFSNICIYIEQHPFKDCYSFGFQMSNMVKVTEKE